MDRKRKKYDREFRLEAIRPAEYSCSTANAEEHELGLYRGSISH